MEREETKKFRLKNLFKKEIFLHVFLISLAIAGSIFNITRLQNRKEAAKQELVDIFLNGYIKSIRQQVKNTMYLSKNKMQKMLILTPDNLLKQLFPKRVNGEIFSFKIESASTPNRLREHWNTSLNRLHNEKTKNPFLFGFVDVSSLVGETICDLYFKNIDDRNMLKGNLILQEYIGKYFSGDLLPNHYLMVCDIFIYMALTVASEKQQKEFLGITIEEMAEARTPVYIGVDEYIFAASLLGELSTAVLGKMVPAEDIKNQLIKDFLSSLSAISLKSSKFLSVINSDHEHFPLKETKK